MDWHKVIFGTVSGMVVALYFDLKSWKAEEGAPWNWKPFIKHLLIGAIGGGATAAGLTLA